MRPFAVHAHPPARARGALVIACLVAGVATLVLLAVLANAALLALTASASPAVERFTLRGDHIEICNLAGKVRVVQGAGTRAEVLVTRGGEDADQLRIRPDEKNGKSRLHVIYPGRRVVYPRPHSWGSRTTLWVGSDGCLGKSARSSLGRRRVTIAGSGSGLRAWADIELRLPRGSRTTVRLGVGEIAAMDVEGDLVLDVATAPVRAERTAGSLLVDTGSGSVELQGNRGDIVVDTGSGSVGLTGLRCGQLKVDTGSGSVTGRDVEAEDLLADTGSGRVELDDVRSGRIGVDTGSGSVQVALLDAPKSLLVDTGSGSVTILGPADLDAEVEIETGSGGIETDYSMKVLVKEHDSLRGTIGEGRGLIRVDTGSGSVRLQRR